MSVAYDNIPTCQNDTLDTSRLSEFTNLYICLVAPYNINDSSKEKDCFRWTILDWLSEMFKNGIRWLLDFLKMYYISNMSSKENIKIKTITYNNPCGTGTKALHLHIHIII